MFDHNEQPTGPHYDEMPFIRSIFDVEEDTYEEEDDIELPLPDEEEELTDPTDVPEPLALLAKMKEVKEAAIRTVVPVKRPRLIGLLGVGLAMVAASTQKKEEDPSNEWDDREESFFQEGDKMSSGELSPPEGEEVPQKKTWWSRLTDKIDSAVEKFGNFLDYAVPTASALTLAATLGGLASQISDFSKTAEAHSPETVSTSTFVPIQTIAIMKATQVSSPVLTTTSDTLWTSDSTPTSNNKFLVEKKTEIVQKAGGEEASYLHSASSYKLFTQELTKITGFGDILKHPEVQKAKNIAEMINIIDRVFGEKVGDLVESNAAAMHLSSASIQSLR